MKILLLSNLYPSNKNPVFGIFVQSQVKELIKRHKCDIILSVSSSDPASFFRKILKYLKLHLLSWQNTFRKFDIIHLHYASASHLVTNFPVLILRRKPLILTLHRGDIYALSPKSIPKFIVKYFLRQAKVLIAVSHDLKSKLVNEFFIDENKIEIIDVGVDLSVFKPSFAFEKNYLKKKLGLSIDKFTLLFISVIRKRKGLDVLFNALKKNRFLQNIETVIIGDGPDKPYFEAMAQSKELKSNVSWMGEIKNKNLPDWYVAADAFILPSRSEGTPTVILEAMASGTPVIATKVGGIPEVITHKTNGLLFDSEDEIQLNHLLSVIYEDTNLREKLARNAYEEIKKHSLQRQVYRINEIYKSTLKDGNPIPSKTERIDKD